jgi:hypothetical protein
MARALLVIGRDRHLAKEARMSLDTLVVILPVIGLAIGASLGAWAVHWLRENRPAWWPGNRD